MKTVVKNIPSQSLRHMKIQNDNLDVEYSVEKGYFPNNISNIQLKVKHLLFIYMSNIAYLSNKYSENKGEVKYEFCIPTSEIAEELGCSCQQIQRSLQELTQDKLISFTGRCINRDKVFKINSPYNSQTDFLIPTILVTTPYITLSLKLFLLKMQLMMKPNAHDTYTFKNKSEFRAINKDPDYINLNLATLESFGLINYGKQQNIIDMKEVYSFLYHDYINRKAAERNRAFVR